MRSVKQLAGKTAFALSLTTTFIFTGRPSFAAEAVAPTEPAIVAQADSTSSETEATEEAAPSEISPETRAKIEELLAITNSNDLNTQLIEGIIAQFREISPEVPEEWWSRFVEKIDYDELNEIVIPIYAQNFTNEELDGIIDFYRTPVGQSVVNKMPAVIQESLVAGQSWGLSIAQEILSDLEADGYDLSAE